VYLYPFRYVLSDADKAPEDPLARGGGVLLFRGVPTSDQNPEIFVGSFALDFVLSTDGSNLDPCYEIWD